MIWWNLHPVMSLTKIVTYLVTSEKVEINCRSNTKLKGEGKNVYEKEESELLTSSKIINLAERS